MAESAATAIRLAGALGVEHRGRRATERDLPGAQPRLAFVALTWNHDRAIPREELAEILWPRDLPSSWQPALRLLVSKVRTVFDLVGLDGARTVTSEAGSYRVELPASSIIDVEEAARRVDEAGRVLGSGGLETARRLAGEARTILSRGLLPGIDSPWLDRRREDLGQALVRCLEVLGECRRRAGDHAHAARVLEDLLRREPFREPAWRLLMRTHAEAGNVAEALRTYERCRELLAEELGTDPSPETQELYLGLLRGAPAPEHPAEGSSVARAPTFTGPPYRGLRYFDQDDASLFFGRDLEIDVLVERLREHRFVAVVGPSGSGKSSLVRAGLLPALNAGALPDADTWRQVVLVPGTDPLEALGKAILDLRSDPAVRGAVERLGRDEAALHDAAAALLAGGPPGEQVLLVVDQFEEVFTLCRDEEARGAFVRTLLRATRRLDARVVLVITLRSDFYGHAAAHPELAAAVSSSQVLVPPLDGDGLQLAIEGPARLAGLRFEDGLVGRILTDVTGEPGALPLFQHALLALYERRADHVLTRAVYHDLGGVSGALARRAEDLWAGLSPVMRDIARRIMLRLTEPGHGTEDTRRRAAVDELITDPESGSATETVIDELTRARLLVASGDPGTEARSIEIAHEALLVAWPRLAGWIDEERAGLRIHRRLTEGAGEWEDHHRDPDFLLSGTRLAEARAWASEHEEDLNPAERAFLAASSEAAQAAARRRSRLRRLVTTGLVTGLVVVGMLAMVAQAQRGRADREEELARSREVAAEAANQLDLDPELGLLLAIEAHGIAPTVQAEAALRQAVVRSTLRHRLATEDTDVAVAVDPNGRLMASWGLSGVAVWDAATGRRTAQLTGEEDDALGGWAVGMAFSPDGGRLLASDLDGRAWIWEVPEGELVASASWAGTGALLATSSEEGVGWSPDGLRALVAGLDGRVRILDAHSGDVLTETQAPGSGESLARARFAPDGRRVATAADGGPIALVDPDTGETMAELAGHEEAVSGLTFSDDGALLVSTSEDGTARLWDTVTAAELHVLRHDAGVTAAAVSGDGTLVVTGDLAGEARIWGASSGETVVDLPAHDQGITRVRLDDAGRLVLTASYDGTARVWDARTGDEIAALVGSSEPVIDAEIAPDGAFAVTAGDDPRIWRVPRGVVSAIDAHEAPALLRLAADGKRMVTLGWFEALARVWDLNDGRELLSIPGQPGTTSAADLSPDGSLVVTSAFNPTPAWAKDQPPPQVWDVETGDLVAELPLPTEDPRGVCGGPCPPTQPAFSPDGTRLAVGSDEGHIGVFDPRTGERLLTTEFGPARHVEWSPDGRRLLGFDLLDWPNPLVIYDAATGEIVHESPPLPRGLTFGLNAFGPDGRVAGSTVGSTARIHDLTTGDVVAELRLRGVAFGLSFSPDGALVATASGAGAELWDLASQRRLAVFEGSQGAHGVAFTPDGDQIAVGGADGTVRFHECEVCRPLDELLDLARERVTRELTPAERARFLHENLPR